jgi:hypothetical protein
MVNLAIAPAVHLPGMLASHVSAVNDPGLVMVVELNATLKGMIFFIAHKDPLARVSPIRARQFMLALYARMALIAAALDL